VVLVAAPRRAGAAVTSCAWSARTSARRRETFDAGARLAVVLVAELHADAGLAVTLGAHRRDPHDLAGDGDALWSSIRVSSMKTSSPSWYLRLVGMNSPPLLMKGMYAA